MQAIPALLKLLRVMQIVFCATGKTVEGVETVVHRKAATIDLVFRTMVKLADVTRRVSPSLCHLRNRVQIRPM